VQPADVIEVAHLFADGAVAIQKYGGTRRALMCGFSCLGRRLGCLLGRSPGHFSQSISHSLGQWDAVLLGSGALTTLSAATKTSCTEMRVMQRWSMGQ